MDSLILALIIGAFSSLGVTEVLVARQKALMKRDFIEEMDRRDLEASRGLTGREEDHE